MPVRCLYETLCEELPDDIEYRRTGSLAVVESDIGLPAMAAMVGRLQGWGLHCQMLGNQELLEIEPGLAPDLAGGAYFPTDGMVNPLLTTQALARAAQKLGAVIETQREVTGIECEGSGGAVSGVLTPQGRIPTGRVVIACGAWSAVLAQTAGLEIPIQPRKGTLVVTATCAGCLYALQGDPFGRVYGFCQRGRSRSGRWGIRGGQYPAGEKRQSAA